MEKTHTSAGDSDTHTIEIAAATEADIAGIQLTAAESWRAAYAGIFTPDFIEAFIGRAYSTESLRRVIHSTQSVFVVARDEGMVMGFCHAGFAPRNAELYRIYLRPAYWGSGTGERLLAQTEAWLREEGYSGYGCFVHSRNAIGRKFYERQHFRRMPEYDHDEDLYMWKEL
jgi:GNAT superfamily N-acetyltransferase